MTAMKSIQRRVSFHRSSDPDVSASYHRSTAGHQLNLRGSLTNPKRLLKKTPSFLRRSSFTLSFTSSFTSDVSPDDDGDDVDLMAIDQSTQDRAVEFATETRDKFRASLPEALVRSSDARDCIAPFQEDEIQIGPKLGSGEFSNVYEVASFCLNQSFDDETNSTAKELNGRLRLKQRENYRDTKNARFAIKHIKEDYFLMNNSESYVQAASDLALEAELLASLVHPNIIKLRGIAHAGTNGFAHGPSGYFLVIDRLFETLDQRLMKWRDPVQGASSGRMLGSRRRMSCMPSISSTCEDILKECEPKVDYQEMLDERLSVAFQISAAMQYLHKNNIIFRDLKPQNVGFDVRGDVKLFDFGLARIIPEGDPNNDLFEMSGAGSPRYMAPELLSGDAYNIKADVYTFAVVLWEILSGVKPYIYCNRMRVLIQHVVRENGRPMIDEKWPSHIRGMLESSFYSEIEKRPTMQLWYKIIRETLVNLRGGNERGLNDSYVTRRRTLESMKNFIM